MNFYALIIGTEILNARREDKHFKFVRDELQKYGYELFATFIVKDDVKLMKSCYELIKKDKNSILFSFGGIGSTPDDLTREIASEIFTKKPVVRHKVFEQDIIDRFAEKAYPHRVHMADLPHGSELLFNPVNNMSGFSLENRFFFVPGFPEMAHPMINSVISKLCSLRLEKFRLTLLAQTSEETLISQMQLLPKHIELSSLPLFKDGKANVELSISGYDEEEVQKHFEKFIQELESKNILYKLLTI
ncbi:molybdopterin cofactor biosynthesis protein [Sulfurimonas gotlandica GD1]|jgi:molybdopterin-biosynthesis enzyme MoeA-like protein|uniref:Molybdopterin cofactor biosynthesis protein n=2 Tax=Sulfurimonas TaxID=202746 RepID=B6BLN6_SULGG|nr:molybdopterin-binding protein [Sulfurimonas gotlandica]EDZ62036.1 molybdopterin binding domain protein [Sulfurimonas gotlandica GD1]EHP28694.1 molybdopterin cofactor biosynthesis protein [Sulfurimonas gotlandica GD1]